MISRKNCPELTRLQELRTKCKFFDLNIKVEEESFPCHKIALFQTVGHIRTKLSAGNNNGARKLKVTCVNAEEFKLVLDFVYGQPVPINVGNIINLLKLADRLDVEILQDACIKYFMEIGRMLFPSNILAKIFIFAQGKSLTTVTDKLIEYLAENFVAAIESRQLYHISESNLMKIFTHPSLQRNITPILNFLRGWIKFHETDVGKLPQMLDVLVVEEELRDWIHTTLAKAAHELQEDPSPEELLPLLEVDILKESYPPPFLFFIQDKKSVDIGTNKSNMREYKLLNPTNELRARSTSLLEMNNSFKSKSFFFGDAQLTLVHNRPFNSPGHKFKMYAKVGDWSDTLTLLNSYEGGPCPAQTHQPGVRKFNNIFTTAFNKASECIYIYNNFEFIVYACESNTWHVLQGYNNTLAPSMCSLDTCLYMAGGLDYTTLFGMTQVGMPTETNGKSFSRYDMRLNRWEPLPPMTYARCGAASCVYQDCIYVSGGGYMTYFNNPPVEYFDTRNNTWFELDTFMPAAKMGHCCLEYNDYLWFFGGQAPLSEAPDLTWFSYHIPQRNWSEISPLPANCGDFTIKQILDVHPAINQLW